MIRRLFVEKKEGFDVQAVKQANELKEILKVKFSCYLEMPLFLK